MPDDRLTPTREQIAELARYVDAHRPEMGEHAATADALIAHHEPTRDAQNPSVNTDAATPTDNLTVLLAKHREMLETNPYAYFELGYTRTTEWMAWICSNHKEADPNRVVYCNGQGFTAEAACAASLRQLAEAPEGGVQ